MAGAPQGGMVNQLAGQALNMANLPQTPGSANPAVQGSSSGMFGGSGVAYPQGNPSGRVPPANAPMSVPQKLTKDIPQANPIYSSNLAQGPAMPNINQAAAMGIYGAGAGTAAGMGYTPEQVQAGQLSSTDIGQYMNPYTEQVIRANEADILRGAQMGLDVLGAKAQAAGAYGGSRQAIAEAEYGRNVAQQLAQASAGLRQAGFQNAQQAALADIQNRMTAGQFNVGSGLQGQQQKLAAANQLANISNLGFGMGQTVQQNLASQGAQQQALQQALFDAAQQQYAGYTGYPQQTIGYLSQALGATPVPQTQTTSRQPGLMDYLSTGLAAYGAYAAASDINLKKDIKLIKTLKNGIRLFSWKWNDKAKQIGADVYPETGVIAQEVKKTNPDAVFKGIAGYLMVDYSKLNLAD